MRPRALLLSRKPLFHHLIISVLALARVMPVSCSFPASPSPSSSFTPQKHTHQRIARRRTWAPSVHTPDVLPFRAGPEEDRLRALCLVSPRSQPLLARLPRLHQLQTAQTPQEDNESKEECLPKGVVGPPEGAQATHEDDHACITLLRKLRASTGIRCHQASPNAPTPLTVSASSCGERSTTGLAAEGWSACDRLGSPVGHSLVVGGETDGRIMGRVDGRKGGLVGGQIETAAALSPTHSARSQAQTGPASPSENTYT